MNINIFTGFSKKKNSTKVPSGTGTAVTASLKRQTSYHNPVFVLSPVTGVNMEDISYVKYGSHYYFVTDITVVPNNVYEISCAEDPMATHRSEILGSTQYVMRSASNFDVHMADSLIAKKTGRYVGKHLGSTASMGYSNVGYYVLDCVTALSAGLPEFTAHYLMTSADVNALANILFQTSDNDIITDLFNKLIKCVSDPFASVIALRWIPYDLGSITTGNSYAMYDSIRLGDVDLSTFSNYTTPNGYLISGGSPTYTDGRLYTDTCELTFTAADAGEWRYKDDFRLSPPFTTAQLFIPGYGFIDINPVECAYAIQCARTLDILTGDVVVEISGKRDSNSGYEFQQSVQFNVAVQVPIAQMASNIAGSLAGVAGATLGIIGAASGGAALAGIGMAGSFIGGVNSLTEMVPKGQAKGGITGRAWLNNQMISVTEYAQDTQNLDTPQATQGRPLGQEVILSTLSGFCQCANASVSIAGYDEDRDYINNVLNSGFFIE